VTVQSLLGRLVLKPDVGALGEKDHRVELLVVWVGNAVSRGIEDEPLVVGVSVGVEGDLLF
jgi:hypothetical protein